MLLRKLMFSIFVLSSVVILSGCGEKGSEAVQGATDIDTNYLKVEDVKAAEGVTTFGYKLEKGDKFSYKVAFINKISQDMKADTVISQKVDQRNVLIIDFEVKDVDKDTIAEVEVTTRSVYVKSDLNGKVKEYKTGDKLDSTSRIDFGFYEALSGNSFMARIDKKGTIREVYKVDKIVDNALPKTNGKDSISAQQREMATTEVAENLKGMILQVFRNFSNGSLKANETYSDKKPPVADPSRMYQLNATQLYTLKEKGKFNGSDISIIEAGYDASYEFNPELAQQGIKVDKSLITGGGKVYYNDKEGKLQKSRTNLVEEIAFSGEIPDKTGKKIPFTSVKKSLIVNIVEKIK